MRHTTSDMKIVSCYSSIPSACESAARLYTSSSGLILKPEKVSRNESQIHHNKSCFSNSLDFTSQASQRFHNLKDKISKQKALKFIDLPTTQESNLYSSTIDVLSASNTFFKSNENFANFKEDIDLLKYQYSDDIRQMVKMADNSIRIVRKPKVSSNQPISGKHFTNKRHSLHIVNESKLSNKEKWREHGVKGTRYKFCINKLKGNKGSIMQTTSQRNFNVQVIESLPYNADFCRNTSEQLTTLYSKRCDNQELNRKDAIDICIDNDVFILNKASERKNNVDRKESNNSVASSCDSLKQSSNFFNLSGLIYKSKFNNNGVANSVSRQNK